MKRDEIRPGILLKPQRRVPRKPEARPGRDYIEDARAVLNPASSQYTEGAICRGWTLSGDSTAGVITPLSRSRRSLADLKLQNARVENTQKVPSTQCQFKARQLASGLHRFVLCCHFHSACWMHQHLAVPPRGAIVRTGLAQGVAQVVPKDGGT